MFVLDRQDMTISPHVTYTVSREAYPGQCDSFLKRNPTFLNYIVVLEIYQGISEILAAWQKNSQKEYGPLHETCAYRLHWCPLLDAR